MSRECKRLETETYGEVLRAEMEKKTRYEKTPVWFMTTIMLLACPRTRGLCVAKSSGRAPGFQLQALPFDWGRIICAQRGILSLLGAALFTSCLGLPPALSCFILLRTASYCGSTAGQLSAVFCRVSSNNQEDIHPSAL